MLPTGATASRAAGLSPLRQSRASCHPQARRQPLSPWRQSAPRPRYLQSLPTQQMAPGPTVAQAATTLSRPSNAYAGGAVAEIATAVAFAAVINRPARARKRLHGGRHDARAPPGLDEWRQLLNGKVRQLAGPLFDRQHAGPWLVVAGGEALRPPEPVVLARLQSRNGTRDMPSAGNVARRRSIARRGALDPHAQAQRFSETACFPRVGTR